MRNTPLRPVLLAALALAATAAVSRASDADEIKQLREQLRALETKLLVLERHQEIQDERVAVTDKGYTFASADGANSIKFRELVQLDSRLFFHDGGGIANNAFVLRRARLIVEGALAKNYGYQVVTEFGGSSVSILEANFTVALTPSLQFRFGRFKEPIGLERLQSDSWTFFNERSIVTNLTPDRDLGVQASGDLLNGRVNYALGVFNGLPDAANNSTNTDFDNDKNVAGRVFASPFKAVAGSPLQGLSFGVGGSFGREKTASGRTAGYKTDGQQTFFAYNAAVVADGQTWRVSPQLDSRRGPFGLLGEYVISTVNVRPSATGPKTELQNKAWQLAAGYVLTGENSSAAGVVPREDFDFAAGTWGAFEVAARYADFKVDDNAFPLFASAASNADEAKSLGLGLNWYLSKAVAFKIDCYQTKFGFSPLAPAISAAQILRQDEKAFITRFQLSF
jgi:phosphate-selective porin OprO/OprP